MKRPLKDKLYGLDLRTWTCDRILVVCTFKQGVLRESIPLKDVDWMTVSFYLESIDRWVKMSEISEKWKFPTQILFYNYLIRSESYHFNPLSHWFKAYHQLWTVQWTLFFFKEKLLQELTGIDSYSQLKKGREKMSSLLGQTNPCKWGLYLSWSRCE